MSHDRQPASTISGVSPCVLLLATLSGVLLLNAFLPTGYVLAQDLTFKPSEIEFFESKVRPLLIQHCLECHGAKESKVRGGLRLTSRAEMIKGGDSGAAIVPGKPDESMLIESVHYDLYEMPPTGKLPEDKIAILEKWIEMGAPDPRNPGEPDKTEAIDLEQAKKFWAFQPITSRSPVVEDEKAWATTEIDRYLLESMQKRKVYPLADADRYTLVRRVYLTLIGLPPSPDQIEDFVSSGNAIEDDLAVLIDDLLASKQYGERWGRHWLDVARFAESSGGGRSLMFPLAWRYRDYVIDSFNADKPFDKFIREQIAGDLLSFDSQSQRNQQVVATGFLALGPTNYEQQDKELLRMEVVDEQIDTVGRAFLGMTLGCARCHDHKFDPIPTRDYYALAGIFKNTKTLVPGNVSGYVKTALESDQTVKEFAAHKKQLATLTKRLNELKKKSKQQKPATDDKKSEANSLDDEIEELSGKIKELRKKAPAPIEYAMSVTEEKKIVDGHIHIRGDVRNLGPVVPRGFISIVDNASERKLPANKSGRLELADWIASPENPLTARVYVNRVWRHIFGTGLVATPDNFGQMGRRPSNPALLDYLAMEFVEGGWSTKKLIRQIMLSRAFRIKAGPPPVGDSTNESFSVYNRRRVEAEILRDSVLAISGQLKTERGGLTIRKITQYDLGYKFDTNRRSVYVPAFRNSMLDLFEVFDMANPNLVVGNRNSSTLPTQALFLMNSPFVIEQSKHATKKFLSEANGDNSTLIQQAYLRVLNRLPSDQETQLAIDYLNSYSEDSSPDKHQAWAGIFHSLFASLEFRYIN